MNKNCNIIKCIKVTDITPEEIKRIFCLGLMTTLEEKLYNFLRDLDEYYPNFREWYLNTVYKEIEQRNGKREILILVSEQNEIIGISILKKTDNEKKICAFRIREDYRKQGIGRVLFEESFKWLGTRKPLISISEFHIRAFEYYIKEYDFQLVQELKGYYKKSIIEYVYNGKLK